MQEIIRCSRCIIPASLPSVRLDSEGVCNYCRKYESLYGNKEKTKEERRKQFEELISKAKKQKRHYDCLITLSGGKDSTYALYLCSKVYKLKCLCITLDNGFLSDYARENIKNVINSTTADHIFYTINRNIMLKLFKMSVVKSGILCSPCMKGIEACGLIAIKAFKIPLFIHGSSAKNGYVIYPEIAAAGEIFPSLLKNDYFEQEANQLVSGERQKYINALKRIVFKNSFMVPSVFSFHDYFDVSREDLYNTIRNEMDWVSPPGEAEHMDCLIHEMPFYIHKLKFPELTKKTAFLAGQVRFGEMSREDALAMENIELAEGKKPEVLEQFLHEINMSEDEFESCARDWKKVDQYRSKMKSSLRSIYRRIVRIKN